MTNSKISFQWGLVAIIILVATFTRLIPHLFGLTELFNFSPLGGIALFGAAYFHKKQSSFLLPFLALWLSNLIIDNVFFPQYYAGFAWFANWEIYLAIALVVTIGLIILKKVSPWRVLAASLSASILFFIVTNFFVWSGGTMYPKTAGGLVTCYIAAIPFFWNTVASDLFFSGVLFGGFEWAKRTVPFLQARLG